MQDLAELLMKAPVLIAVWRGEELHLEFFNLHTRKPIGEGEAVVDAGMGVDPTDHERIFERFGRAASERHFGGLGLGLWITREIVNKMGGSITVRSAIGQGATFTVELPKAPPPDRERSGAPA